ncbi:DUF2306 domain-containing protein [Cohnella sp. LGH]|uniref:DUF2306 domain-containing protein n=1 Tax=Cohnella sp. LGH TaxID=1619153 RepID=UPI001ADC75DD|nr:DUF2306 domain-containing protein [Cohnella sp. LGH]QTH43300.1 DUF2306 domain-containing protein [Cohnella sp. LGH]
MSNAKRLYSLMLIAVAVFVAYALYKNFVHDPQAAEFLGHKSNLKRELNVSMWLNVMYVHVAFACVAMLSGAVNFPSSIRTKYSRFHRINGYVYAISVLIVVLTSGYMAPYATGGKAAGMAFNLLNLLWPAMTLAAIVQIRKKRIAKHRKWMIRSYAFCFTNLSIHLLTTLATAGFGLAYATGYTIGVYGSIVMLLAAAELINRARNRRPTPS